MHEQVVALLEARVEELNTERRLYLDRMFGGTLFTPAAVVQPDSVDDTPDQTAEELEKQKLRSLMNRPSDLAAALTAQFRKRKVQSEHAIARGAHIARMPSIDIDQQIDQAVEKGKALAS